MGPRASDVWTVQELPAALAWLAGFFRLDPVGATSDRDSDGPIDEWLPVLASRCDLEAVALGLGYADVEKTLHEAAPFVLELPDSTGYLLVVSCRGQRVRLRTPAGEERSWSLSQLARSLRAPLEQQIEVPVEELLDRTGCPPPRRVAAKQALLGARLADATVARGWSLTPNLGAPWWTQLRALGVPRDFFEFAACYSVRLTAVLLSWWFLWHGAVAGALDWGWIGGWAVFVLSAHLPIRLLENWFLARVSIRLGWLLRRRSLAGTLKLDPDTVGREGTAGLLGRSLEVTTVERSGVDGVLASTTYLLDLLFYAPALLVGVGGAAHGLLLLGWLALFTAAGHRYYRRLRQSMVLRHELTLDLVEKMVGQPTRVAQQDPAHWHHGEDEQLSRYVAACGAADRWETRLGTGLATGWVLFSLLLILPDFVFGQVSIGRLALSIGAILLIRQTFTVLAQSMLASMHTLVAWRRVAPLLRSGPPAPRAAAPGLRIDSGQDPLVTTRNLGYRYPDRPRPALEQCTLTIESGDRILVEGPSGGGKTTLVSLLAGLRRPDFGVVHLHGLDLQSLGLARWQQSIALTPQFHDNHVFLDTLAFNLLLGRRWPPTERDLAEAREVCRAVGLDELLHRMPAELYEQVGEVGWQLSHGERSRLFLARSLLQGADLLLLDECFGALDPVNLARSLRALSDRPEAIVVIAHP